MSLLDKASLIVTPNAYKESKLYSVIPSDGSGDMTVVRATTATRVNSAGLIEVVPRNLFVYSNDFTNANWTKENSSITTSQIGYDGTNNASLLVENSTTNNHFIRQTPSLSGQTTISVYAKANTRNWLYLRGVQSGVPVFGFFNLSNGTLGTIQTNGTGSITSVGNGWYRCSLTIVNFNTGFEVYIGLSNSDNVTSYLGNGSSIFIQNSQVENFATASNYFPTTTRVNIPRVDYTNGSCPSLLVEPQRTNLALYSEQFNNASWTTNGVNVSITANAIISPDGTSNADNILANSTLDIHNIQQRTGSATSGTTYTMSVYVKKLGYDYCSIQTSNTGTSVGTFRFSTKTLTISGSDVVANSGRVDELANGWFRISLSVLAPASATWRWTINVLNDSGTASFIGDGTKGLSVFGFQMEAGSYPTSYIPTVASSVTRNADVISKTGISSLIGQTEGTLFCEINLPNPLSNGGKIIVGIGTSPNRIYIAKEGSTTNFFQLATQSASGFNFINSSVITTSKVKFAIAYKGSNNAFYINGSLISSASATVNPTSFSNLLIGDTSPETNTDIKINSVQLYKTRLTNTELAQLTTL